MSVQVLKQTYRSSRRIHADLRLPLGKLKGVGWRMVSQKRTVALLVIFRFFLKENLHFPCDLKKITERRYICNLISSGS